MVDLVTFGETGWYVYSLIEFKTYSPVIVESELVVVEQRFAINATGIVYVSLGNTRLRITRQETYHEYYWCVNPPWMSPPRFCVPYNSYTYTRMLEPGEYPFERLVTIVPTQLSSFI